MASELPPDVVASLQQLLQGLAATDNAIRSSAEEVLNNDWIATKPDMLLSGLAEQIRNSTARSFSAVLFRRLASKAQLNDSNTQELYIACQPTIKIYIRNTLLQAFAQETDGLTRNKIGDAIAEVARQLADADEQWPELLDTLFQASKSPDASHREGAFRIFTTTPGIIEKQHGQVVKNVFTAGFQDSGLSVRISSMEAFAAFFRSIKKSQQKQYYDLLSFILGILVPLKESQDSDKLSKALMALIDLAEISPAMFKPMFNEVVRFSIGCVQDKELGDQTRQNALEFLATFADTSPQMCRKDPSYTSEMVTQCLSLMTDIGADDDDAAEWNDTEDPDSDESDLNHVAGEQCMDRLANRLGGNFILAPTFQWLPRMMTSSSWRDRHAALMAISAISEGCREMMEGELDKILDLVVPALKDAHPRVRWAGCNALGQMSTDFAGIMQEKYHRIVLSSIIPVLESPEARVQSHAAAALVNFCEEAEKEILEPYLDDLLKRLLALLTADTKRYVQEQALSTIATIADSAEQAFGRYYDHLMPLLFNVLNQPQTDKENRLLNAKAMECATLIALAVGRERLAGDAIQLVNVLGRIQQSVSDPDDPQGSYLLHCWGRMCRVMGNDFLPYLPAVMPPLLELASAKADVQLLEDDDQLAALENADGWELLPVRGKYIGIKTSALDDKYMAIELLVIYAQQLEAAFEPYVNAVLKDIAMPGLKFFFNDAVRVASAKLIPQLFNSIKKAHGPQSPQLAEIWGPTVRSLLEILAQEPAVDALAEMYQCFYESVEIVGQNSLDQETMGAFIGAAEASLREYQLRHEARVIEAQKPEDEREDADEYYAIEDDQTLLADMNKAFHTIFKNQGVTFLPQWERLMPFYSQFVNSEDATQRQWALCIIDDVLEFCGPESFKYQAHFSGPLVQGLTDKVAANRQAAAYGVGVAAKNGGPAWADFVAHTMRQLFECTTMPQARKEDHVFATENACASIAKILRFNNSKVPDVQGMIGHWINTLPVVNDDEAAPYAYGFLSELIDQKHPAVLANAARVFDFIVSAVDAETLQGQTAERVIQSAKTLVAITGLNLQQIVTQMPAEKLATVRKYFA
ncbi:armadillo-type protein [Pyronema domesticum]|uniref:Similar to Importin subunit beta-3 acc. no. O74476 n=1 Tax=Pyronema omphalodes (strain CBS 100304) TaxID=1076935 RepID=U4LPD6_PYROM|nr:armadillo-type protein [Pyronema domesticum]CCX33785.1 Similar to Importin subunit beta-3; acc. no. O74476 [Pyronema omphalodes CBS 100304]